MQTLAQYFAGPDSVYRGERAHHLVVLTVHRESDCLGESNFSVAKARLGERGTVERASHWAVGWVDYLLVDPENPEAVTIASEIEASLADYPILDEEDFSYREWEAAGEVWAGFSTRGRIAWLRDHAHGCATFAELLGAARGRHFSGNPSEILA